MGAGGSTSKKLHETEDVGELNLSKLEVEDQSNYIRFAWETCFDDGGNLYYFNGITGKFLKCFHGALHNRSRTAVMNT